MSKKGNSFYNILNKLKEAPSGFLTKIILGIAIFFIGVFVLFLGLTSNLKNTNAFTVPDSAPEGQFTLYTIESDNLKDLNYTSLTEQEIKIEKYQKSISFISSNAKDKLKEFIKQNKGQNFLGMENGTPKYNFNLYAVSVFPLMQDDKQITTEKGSLLYKGYENFDDFNNGINKYNFAVTGSSIEKLENGAKIQTNVGEIELKQGE